MTQCYKHILVDETFGVGTVTLNRPGARNALSRALVAELMDALGGFDESPDTRVIVIQGDELAFSAGADIAELARDSTSAPKSAATSKLGLQAIASITKPIIAAVSGFALGGGCELALLADVIIAAESAQFGLPEILLGIIPGAGGTQRLPRAVGRVKAADLILTGRRMGANEAERAGLVSRVVADADLADQARIIALEMATRSLPALIAAKRALRVAQTEPLERGLMFEHEIWQGLMGTPGQSAGMAEFLGR